MTKHFLEREPALEDLAIAKTYICPLPGTDKFAWQMMEVQRIQRIVKKLIDSPFVTRPVRAKLEALPI